MPAWIHENRTPSFVRTGLTDSLKGLANARKSPWGDMPALDILKLAENEGESYQGPLRLLFVGMYYCFLYLAMGLPGSS